jgi:streptogramin lyase
MVISAFLAVWLTAPGVLRPPAPGHQPRYLHEFTLPLGTFPLSIKAGADGALWFTTFPALANHNPINLGVGRITLHGKQTYYLIDNGTYDLTLATDGKIWFTNPYFYVGSSEVPRVGSITTKGKWVEYAASPGSPESIVASPDGAIWYVNFGANKDIVRIDENGKTVAKYRSPRNAAVKIGLGPNGQIWFDRYGRRSAVGYITASDDFVVHHLGGPAYIPGPLTLGADGRVWVSDCSYVAAVTPSLHVTRYALPAQTSCMTGITAGPDGNLWTGDYGTSSLLRIGVDGTMTEYPTPTPNMSPNGITVGPDGNIWFTEIQTNTDVAKIGVLAP